MAQARRARGSRLQLRMGRSARCGCTLPWAVDRPMTCPKRITPDIGHGTQAAALPDLSAKAAEAFRYILATCCATRLGVRA